MSTTRAKVRYCIPAQPGALTWSRVEAGWRVGLDCERGCEYSSPRRVDHDTEVEHVCDAESERLIVPADGDVPSRLFTDKASPEQERVS